MCVLKFYDPKIQTGLSKIYSKLENKNPRNMYVALTVQCVFLVYLWVKKL